MKTLFEFINDNWRIWPTKEAFAVAHDISPQRLNGWLKEEYTTDSQNVFSSKSGKKMFVDSVEFRIRGIE